MNKRAFRLSLVYFIIPFCFLIGISWGLYVRQERIKPEINSKGKILRILVLKDFLPKTFLENFSQQYNTKLEVTTTNNTVQLMKTALSQRSSFDLILSHSMQASFLTSADFLSPIDFTEIPHIQDISRDFFGLPFDKDELFFAPILWGIMGFWGSAPSNTETTIESVLESNGKKQFYSSTDPLYLYQIFTLSQKVSPVWVQNNQSELLSSSFTKTINGWSFFSNWRDLLKLTKNHPNPSFSVYGPHTLKDENLTSIDVGIKNQLVLWLWAIPKSAKNRNQAHLFIDFTIQNQAVLAQNTLLACTSLICKENKNIIPSQWAQQMRKTNLYSFTIPEGHLANEPSWTKTLDDAQITKLTTSASN